MAIFENDPFPGTDYSSFQNWKPVQLPDGRVMYTVPSAPGYVYDPVLSAARGRKVFMINPQAKLDLAQQEQEAIQKQREQQEFAASPTGQLLPIAANIGGLYAANQLINAGGAAGANAALSSTGAAASGAASGAGVAPVLPSIEASNAVASSTGTAPTGLFGGVAPMASSYGGLGALAGIGGATYLGGREALNLLQGKDDKSLQGRGGRVVLGMATGGLSELARPFMMRKSTKEIEKGRWKGTGLDPEKYQQMIGKDYFAGTGGEQSRDEKFLTPDAIRFNPDNYNNAPDWDTWTKQQQDTFLNRMLQAGKVREKKGGIYYDDDFAKQTAVEIRNPAPAQQPAQTGPMVTPNQVASNMVKNLTPEQVKGLTFLRR